MEKGGQSFPSASVSPDVRRRHLWDDSSSAASTIKAVFIFHEKGDNCITNRRGLFWLNRFNSTQRNEGRTKRFHRTVNERKRRTFRAIVGADGTSCYFANALPSDKKPFEFCRPSGATLSHFHLCFFFTLSFLNPFVRQTFRQFFSPMIFFLRTTTNTCVVFRLFFLAPPEIPADSSHLLE